MSSKTQKWFDENYKRFNIWAEAVEKGEIYPRNTLEERQDLIKDTFMECIVPIMAQLHIEKEFDLK